MPGTTSSRAGGAWCTWRRGSPPGRGRRPRTAAGRSNSSRPSPRARRGRCRAPRPRGRLLRRHVGRGPIGAPTPVRSSVASVYAFAIPKSAILIPPRPVRRTFSGWRSGAPAVLLGVRQPGKQALEHAEGLRARHSPDPGAQRAAREVLHRDVGHAVVHEGVEDVTMFWCSSAAASAIRAQPREDRAVLEALQVQPLECGGRSSAGCRAR